MTDIRAALSVAYDGTIYSADEMRELLQMITAHFKQTDSPAGGAELLGVMSAMECLTQLDDTNAEAMRSGFRLALHLARFDFPLVQTAIARERHVKSIEAKALNTEIRHVEIRERARELAKNYEWRDIAKRLKDDPVTKDLSIRQIREIIKPIRPD